MISVIIPTLDAESRLAATLTALVPAVVDGTVRQVIVVDGGSRDRTLEISDQAGADILQVQGGGRGRQLAEGAGRASQPWMLFLHADSVLADGWYREASSFMDLIESGRHPPSAAAFRFALDDLGIMPRLVEFGVSLRCNLFRLPYGDQGLLIPSALYKEIGGYSTLPLMEDVEIVKRLGRARTAILRSQAVTSAARYKRDGYLVRAARNLSCFALYKLGFPISLIQKLYG